MACCRPTELLQQCAIRASAALATAAKDLTSSFVALTTTPPRLRDASLNATRLHPWILLLLPLPRRHLLLLLLQPSEDGAPASSDMMLMLIDHGVVGMVAADAELLALVAAQPRRREFDCVPGLEGVTGTPPPSLSAPCSCRKKRRAHSNRRRAPARGS
jgi:hypothetical protein